MATKIFKVVCAVARSPHVIVPLTVNESVLIEEIKSVIVTRQGYTCPMSEISVYSAATLDQGWISEIDWKREIASNPGLTDELELWSTESVVSALRRFSVDMNGNRGQIHLIVRLPYWYDTEIDEANAKRDAKLLRVPASTKDRWDAINRSVSGKTSQQYFTNFTHRDLIRQTDLPEVAIDREMIRSIAFEFGTKQQLYGPVVTGMEPSRLFFIELMIDAMIEVLTNEMEKSIFTMEYKRVLSGEYLAISSCPDFVIKRDGEIIVAVIVGGDRSYSLTSAIMTIDIIADVQDEPATVITTDFRAWTFLQMENGYFAKDDVIFTDPINHTEIDRVLGKLCASGLP